MSLLMLPIYWKVVGAIDLVKGRAINPGTVGRTDQVDTNNSLVLLCRSNQGISLNIFWRIDPQDGPVLVLSYNR